MDRKQMILLFVFTALMMISMFYFQSRNKPTPENQRQAVPAATANARSTSVAATSGNAAIQPVNLANNELKISVSPVGGQLNSVELAKYRAYNQKTDRADLPLYLISKNNSSYGFVFKDKTGKTINTRDLVFTPTVAGNQITMTAAIAPATLQFVYALLPNYTVDFQVKSSGLNAITADSRANFNWDYSARNLEKGRSQEETHTEFSYALNNYDTYDYDARGEMDEKDEVLNWVGVKQQFFATLIEAQGGFRQSTGKQDVLPEGQTMKNFSYNGQVEMQGGEMNQNFRWYFLPLDLKLLKKYEGKNFDEILPLGWSFIGWMNRGFFIPVYNWIAGLGIEAGWAIFLLTILVKLILSPVMFRQHKLSAMMRVIRPEIDAVNEQYKDADAMKRQQATMEVQRKAGVNQMAGCLPALLQVPIFYALFRFFPNFIDLRGQSFLWAKDLTAYDDLIKLPFSVPLLGDHLSIFAIACTAVILIYTMMTSGSMQQVQQPGMPNMKIMMYIFPITFLFFLNNSASGLSWYYFVSNALNIVIILIIKNFILDEKRIHAQIQMNKTQPKKEGKFQQRMREMMEKAQEQQRLQQEQANRGKKK